MDGRTKMVGQIRCFLHSRIQSMSNQDVDAEPAALVRLDCA